MSALAGKSPQGSVVDSLLALLAAEPLVAGVYLAGSLANRLQDRYSDVDLGIVSADDPASLEAVWGLRHRLVEAVGRPITLVERGWEHCQMVAALYGKSRFPPVGLEVDLVFSQLQHVGQQMPYGDYRLLLDRDGRLALALDQVRGPSPPAAVAADLRLHLGGLPFVVHDALKAVGRGDAYHLQSLLDSLRQSFFAVAAARSGGQAFGAKRAWGLLTPAERAVVEGAGQAGAESIVALVGITLDGLRALPPTLDVGAELAQLEGAIGELL